MIGLTLPADTLDIVCLGAHPDDVEIGCGATLLTLAHTRRVRATVLVMSGTDVRAAEARAAASEFLAGADLRFEVGSLPDGRFPARWEEAKQLLESLAATTAPDVVFAPSSADAHQDHRLIGELVSTVWRNSLVLHYEIPKWDGDIGRPNHYVPVTDDVAESKVALLSKCYPSQLERDWWTDDLFLGMMRMRGMECRSRYAEAFHASKVTLDLGARRAR